MYITEDLINAMVKIADDTLWSFAYEDEDGEMPYGITVPEGAVEYLTNDILPFDSCPPEFEHIHTDSKSECRYFISHVIDSAVYEYTDGKYCSIEELYEFEIESDIESAYPGFNEFTQWITGYSPKHGSKTRSEFARAVILKAAGFCSLHEFDIPEGFHEFFDGIGGLEMPTFGAIGYVSYGDHFVTAFQDENGYELGGDE